jgi:lysyl-tRNA synthetase class 2
MDSNGFLEVETPILQPSYGGAAAEPLVTYHNQLKQDLYLRISFELYLKRLLVGGIERVYEIGRDFRNEGAFVADKVLGTRTITYQGQTFDLNPPWKRIELRQGIIDATDIDIEEFPTGDSLAAHMKVKGIEFKPDSTRGKLIDTLLGDFLEPNLIQPTFLYNYPRDISPLAKSMPGDSQTVERFEGFMAGMELCNAFTELNDPLDQESRFVEMGRDYASDDEERHPMDDDYLRSMRYGMPPNGGFGMGVDRLVMLLTDQPNIREVILFPHLRTREE